MHRAIKTRIPTLLRSRSLMTKLRLPIAFSIALGTSEVDARPTTMLVRLLITTIFVMVSFAKREISSVKLVNLVQCTKRAG